jgi:hypothetical protein
MRYSLMLFIISIGCLTTCKSPTGTVEAETFSVKVTTLYFGHNNSETRLTQDSIIAAWDQISSSPKTYNRKLTIDEKAKVKRFMNRFPIKAFEEQYINEKVKDGTQLKFDIFIGSTEKHIFVANYYIEELGALVDLINTLVPIDYIGYTMHNVPYK